MVVFAMRNKNMFFKPGLLHPETKISTALGLQKLE